MKWTLERRERQGRLQRRTARQAAGGERRGERDDASYNAQEGTENGTPAPAAPHRRLRPAAPFVVPAPSFPTPRAAPHDLIITWVGHSSFLVQIGGLNVLLDPMWGERASPVSFAGPRRLVPPAVRFDALPPVDVVVQSHDHYDHLDRGTVRRLVRRHPDAAWVAPLGVGAWLHRRRARVAAELDWWERASVRGLEITCTPAQHFSGRRVNNRNATLWSGWTIRAGDRVIYFAGDTARHPEYSAITRALGPFDAALLPIGAYDPRWFMRPVHMDPEEAVSAYRDIAAANGGRACTFIAMHWGTFRLTEEPVDEPPRRTRESWARASLPGDQLWIPRHGESRRVGG